MLSPKAKLLYKKVIESSNKLGRMHKKIASFKTRLASAEKLNSSPSFSGLMNHVNETTYKFILSQVRTQKQRPKGRRFTIDDKLLALALLKGSGKGYRLLSTIFSLPSRRTLTNLLHKLPIKPGINAHIFKSMEEIVRKMKPIDRHSILLFDEMAIDSLLHYNQKQDLICGLEDMGDGHRTQEIADHANVFMVKGLFRQWKQPICYTFTGGPHKSLSLKDLIKVLFEKCHSIGLKIMTTVCDQGGANQAAINQLILFLLKK